MTESGFEPRLGSGKERDKRQNVLPGKSLKTTLPGPHKDPPPIEMFFLADPHFTADVLDPHMLPGINSTSDMVLWSLSNFTTSSKLLFLDQSQNTPG